MTALEALRSALEAAVRELPDEDLPAALAAIAEADARMKRRYLQAAARPAAIEFLTVDEACDLALMPRRRLLAIARRKDAAAWVKRVNRKTLLIEKAGLLAWLAARGRVTGPPRKRSPNGAARHRNPRQRGDHGRFVHTDEPPALAARAKVAS